MKILLVTNDFPPRVGGIQNYLLNIYTRLPQHEITVLAPAHPGDAAFDATLPFEVVRHPTRIYWPAPELRRVVAAMAKRVDALVFGAVLPMNLVASSVDIPVVVHTHGFEVAWARVPALLQALRRIGERASLVTVVSEFTARFIRRAIGERAPIHMLRTGVDLERFHPSVDGSSVRKRHGLDARPVVCCVSRLVSRKGQDQLIRALPFVREEIPDAALLLVGGGTARERLERLAKAARVTGAVAFAGEVSEAELAAHYAAGDVFCMPVRSRYAGLEVEGLGLVYLEAQACGRPAITGDSGGAPEAVVPGETGLVVGGTDTRGLADAVVRILGDPPARERMGRAGRAFVEANHRWADVASRYGAMLDEIL
ncbi:MAG: glycosyltransferase family 4 protein [Actinomycetota bacterium]|nr:glycosyltransferase family 4 protein [Actinomycetota bacterium]